MAVGWSTWAQNNFNPYNIKEGHMATRINGIQDGVITLSSEDYFVHDRDDEQVPNQELADHLIGLALESLEGLVAWRTEPSTTVGPYGGRPTNVIGLIENGDEYQGFLLQIYVNGRSTREAVAALERQREAEKRKAYVASLIEGPLALEPAAPAKKGRRS